MRGNLDMRNVQTFACKGLNMADYIIAIRGSFRTLDSMRDASL